MLICLGEDEGTKALVVQSLHSVLAHWRAETDDLKLLYNEQVSRHDRGAVELRSTDKVLPTGLDWRALRFYFPSP